MAELAGQGYSRLQSWFDSLQIYRHPRVVAMLFLGFSAGLPYFLIFGTLSAWLRQEEVERAAITYFSWVGILFSFKFVWAPIIDRAPLPQLTKALGRRRSWMLAGQIGILTALVGIALSNPATQLAYVAMLCVFLAFSSATQDISMDAYRIEAVPPNMQGAMAATYQLGYRLGMIVSGAGALYIAASNGWRIAYLTMAALVFVGVITVLVIQEPTPPRNEAADEREKKLANSLSSGLGGQGHALIHWVSAAVISPFVDFFSRMGRVGIAILGFIAVYKLSDVVLGIIANVFYIDLGFTLSQIASVTKVFGVVMTMIGAVVGGMAVSRYGIMRPVLAGAVLIATTNLLFASLALVGADLAFLTLTISADNFTQGFAGAAFIAYMSSLTNTAYTATQYALFSSIILLPGKLIGGLSGTIVDVTGYFPFFVFASAMGIPAIALSIFLMLRGPETDSTPAAAKARI